MAEWSSKPGLSDSQAHALCREWCLPPPLQPRRLRVDLQLMRWEQSSASPCSSFRWRAWRLCKARAHVDSFKVIRLLIHMHMEVNHLEKTLVAFPTPCSLLTKKNKEKGFLSPPSYNGMLAKLYKLLWEAKGQAREPLNKDLQMDSHVTKRCSPKETFLSGLIIFKFCNTFVFISLC